MGDHKQELLEEALHEASHSLKRMSDRNKVLRAELDEALENLKDADAEIERQQELIGELTLAATKDQQLIAELRGIIRDITPPLSDGMDDVDIVSLNKDGA